MEWMLDLPQQYMDTLTGWLALSTVWGVYLGASGIVLITDYFSERRRRKATA